MGRRRHRPAVLLALVLVLLLAAPLRASLAPPYAFGLQDSVQGATSAGSLETAQVSILGVPALVVTSPTLGRNSTTPSARQRAAAIQGNLTLIYMPLNLCTPAETITESVLETVLATTPRDLSCQGSGVNRFGDPGDLQVRVQVGPGGSPVLEAFTSTRTAPLPLLTVTPEDARYHGTSQSELAERWRARLERRLRHARRVFTREQLFLRWRVASLALVVLLLLAAGLLLLWTHN